MLQNELEFRQLLGLYCDQQPARVLEVGVGEGGTLWNWLQCAPEGALVVAVDDRHQNRDAYDGWLPADVELVTITGSSQDPDVVLDVARHRPFDWIFIDADHHDHAVRADWRHYARMAADGAIVGLHDICPSDDPTIHVDVFWRELQAGYTTGEFVVPGGPGIGVVHIEDAES